MLWGGFMHYNIHYEVTKDVSKLITISLLRLYEIHKDDEKIFPKCKEEGKFRRWKYKKNYIFYFLIEGLIGCSI